jgi:hypothetical protein
MSGGLSGVLRSRPRRGRNPTLTLTVQTQSRDADCRTCCLLCWERIWERNAAQLPRWRETRRDGWDRRLSVTCADETDQATRDGDWLTHSPEVAGSNPVRY